MPARTYVKVEEKVVNPFAQTKIPTGYLLVLYARQSQKDAHVSHRESYELQTEELFDYALSLGWTRETILIQIENRRKDGKWRKASGTLRIDEREGLQTTVGYIERDEAKAVMLWAVDRLFRHEDMIEPHIFVKICKDHNCIIITRDEIFDFNHPTRGDADIERFLKLCKEAANYIKHHIKGRMIPAANRVSRRGEYDGRCLPTGFYVLEGEKKPRAQEMQIQIINRLFKRFKELDGRFNLLWREVATIRDLFPPYPLEAKGVKPYTKQGPFGITRDGLINILTNQAYIGIWEFRENGKNLVSIPDIYPVAVDEEDFWFAFNHLSKETLDGEVNRQRSIGGSSTRFDRVGTIPAEALLEGIVSCPIPGCHVYVLQNADNPQKAAYSIQAGNYAKGTDAPEGYILVRELDPIFEVALKNRLRIFQAMDDVINITGSKRPTEESIYAYLKKVQAMTNQALAGVSTQIAGYEQELVNIERTLRLSAHLYEDDDIIRMSERAANLSRTLKELKEKDKKRIEDEDLKKAAALIMEASTSYEGMEFENKQKLVRISTIKLELGVLAPRWLTLTIGWSPFLGIALKDSAFIWHPSGAGGKWSDEELEILGRMYETADKDSVLEALYNRSWTAIKNMASEKGIKRLRWLKDSQLPSILSLHDFHIMQENGLDFSDPKRRVWWKSSVPDQKSGPSPGICIRKQARKIIIASHKISF